MLRLSDFFLAADDEAVRQAFAVLLGASAASQNGKNMRVWTFATDELATKTNAAWSAGVYANLSYPALDSYAASNRDSQWDLYNGSRTGAAQAFALATGSTIYGCKFVLAKAGTPTGTATISLYAATGTLGTNAKPTGSALASTTLDVATLTTTYTEYTFYFGTPYAATAGNYCVVIEYPGGNSSNSLRVGTDNSTPSHAGNDATYLSGVWTGENTNDLCFTVFSRSIGNATLVPSAVSVASAPTKMISYFLIQAVDAITLNTDLKCEVSRNGGTNWSGYGIMKPAMTYDASYGLYRANFPLSLLPATGTSLLWRLTSYNNKQINVRGAALRWG